MLVVLLSRISVSVCVSEFVCVCVCLCEFVCVCVFASLLYRSLVCLFVFLFVRGLGTGPWGFLEALLPKGSKYHYSSYLGPTSNYILY